MVPQEGVAFSPPPPQKQSEELQSDKSRYSGPALQRFELDSEPGAASCLNVCSWRRWLLLGVKGLREGSTVPVGFGPRDLEGGYQKKANTRAWALTLASVIHSRGSCPALTKTSHVGLA